MGAWFKRNAVALIVIVLAAPALVGVLLGLPLLEREAYDLEPIAVAPGEPIEVDGYTFTLVASQEFLSGEQNDAIPGGLSLVAAIIEVRPTTATAVDTLSCDAMLVSRDELRSWNPLSSESEYNYAVADDSTTSCFLDGEGIDYETVFLAPEDSYGDATVDMEIGGGAGTLVKFELIH